MKYNRQKHRHIGLALSGGGYRAAAFHLGTLRALNKMHLLENIDIISAVSGGSIIATYYALHKHETFEEFEDAFRAGLSKSSLWLFIFNVVVVYSLPIILTLSLSPWWLLLYLGLLLFGFKIIPSSKLIAMTYDRIFFNHKKLNDLPDTPIVAINSTNIATGRLFTFSKQDVGGYDFKPKDGKSIIDGTHIPLSFAVSASTCVPSFFSPRSLSKKYFINGEYRDNLLVDGGLYDNQGAYVLSESTNQLYRAQDIIVSDAGNSQPNSKKIFNTFCLLNQSVEVLMNRIRTMQIKNNIYRDRCDNKTFAADGRGQNFAYLSLRWNAPASMVDRFLSNIKSKHIPIDILTAHNIDVDDVKHYITEHDSNAENRIREAYIKSIEWDDMLRRAPHKELYDLAYKVRTNLMPLSKKKVDALSTYSEWLTELQIKSYLPHLLKSTKSNNKSHE